MDSLEFLARTDIYQSNRFVLLEPSRQVSWLDENACVLLVAGSDVLQNLLRIQARIALANLLQRFVRLKAAMAAAADVIAAKKRPLGARIGVQHRAHL